MRLKKPIACALASAVVLQGFNGFIPVDGNMMSKVHAVAYYGSENEETAGQALESSSDSSEENDSASSDTKKNGKKWDSIDGSADEEYSDVVDTTKKKNNSSSKKKSENSGENKEASNKAQPAALENTAQELKSQVESYLSTQGGTWSVYYKKMGTNETFSYGDQKMVAASLIKLFVYGAARKKIESGELKNTYDSTLKSMISVSDNTACNTLIDAVGGFSEVNAFISSIGCTNTQLNRKMLASGTENYTSAKDCAYVLESALNGTYVSKETSKMLLEAMAAQTRKSKIPSGVPAGILTANKTGELSGIENDAAVVYSPGGTYILCVMSANGSSGNQISVIKQVSSIVYGYVNK